MTSDDRLAEFPIQTVFRIHHIIAKEETKKGNKRSFSPNTIQNISVQVPCYFNSTSQAVR